MRRLPLVSSVLFGVVVAVCVAQVTWWIVYQLRESERLEAAGRHLAAGETERALELFGAGSAAELADAGRRRRTMFIAEGVTLAILGLIGVVFFYGALVRERRMRLNQERFLTGTTHELKTPLTTLKLGLESLLEDRVPEARRTPYLEGMLREADRLEGGLVNLLAAAGLRNSGGMSPVEGDLAEDIRTSVDHFRPRFAAAGVELHEGRMAPCLLRRDAAAIRLVLHNLLDNALKYSSPGGQVDIELTADGERAKILVRDSGRGITSDDLPHVFDRFYRGTGTKHVGGTGIGLALVRELVEGHRGSVRAASEGPGQGSTFEVSLPLRGGA